VKVGHSVRNFGGQKDRLREAARKKSSNKEGLNGKKVERRKGRVTERHRNIET
jgi:hypothetical protein